MMLLIYYHSFFITFKLHCLNAHYEWMYLFSPFSCSLNAHYACMYLFSPYSCSNSLFLTSMSISDSDPSMNLTLMRLKMVAFDAKKSLFESCSWQALFILEYPQLTKESQLPLIHWILNHPLCRFLIILLAVARACLSINLDQLLFLST